MDKLSIKDLENEDNIMFLSKFFRTGVYFLCNGKDIVYIGQSKNIYVRINNHKDKIFDSVYIIECKETELDDLEKKYIIKYQPPYNDNYVKHGMRVSFWERNNMPIPKCLQSKIKRKEHDLR